MLRRGVSFDGKSVNISGCSAITTFAPFKGAKVVIADGLHIADVSPLADCQRVSLRYNHAVVDVSPLSKVDNLDISFTKVEDITPLWGVRFLTMDCCPKVPQYNLEALLKKWSNIPTRDVLDTVILWQNQAGLSLGDLLDLQEKEMGTPRFLRCGYNPHLEKPKRVSPLIDMNMYKYV